MRLGKSQILAAAELAARAVSAYAHHSEAADLAIPQDLETPLVGISLRHPGAPLLEMKWRTGAEALRAEKFDPIRARWPRCRRRLLAFAATDDPIDFHASGANIVICSVLGPCIAFEGMDAI